jgi:hypothetical protein
VHGFRATFATWAEECTYYPDDVREAALAHKYKNETTAAYQRGAKLEKRLTLMNDWADFIHTIEDYVLLQTTCRVRWKYSGFSGKTNHAY